VTVRSGQLPWWFGIPFLLGGILLLGLGFVLLQDELRYGRDGVSVSGSVVEAVYHPGGGEDGPSYSIRYTYVDPATGSHLAGESDVSEEVFDAADPGEPIEVTYLPAEPSKSRVGSPEPQLFVPVAVMGGGVIFAVIGGGLLFLMRMFRSRSGPGWMQPASLAMAGNGAVAGEPDDGRDGSEAILNMLGMGELVDEARAAYAANAARVAAAAAAAGAEPPAGPAAEPPAETPHHGPTTDAELRDLDAKLAPPPPPERP
jgi:hypothetical protein